MASQPAHTARPKVGLVLGAGGIRGTAHAATIQVMREARIPIDLVVGTSVGAMYGLGLASGMDPEEIVRLARDTSPWRLFRFYAGRLRCDASNPIARMLCAAGGGKDFRDLAMPFAVTATDMETGRTDVIKAGPVLPAVQASIAIPLTARPVPLRGRYYYDGGLLDTAPVHVARDLGAEVVIAVCLGFNYLAPSFLRKRAWTREWLEATGRQRRPIRGTMADQARFMARLCAASYSPLTPAQDADVAIWPEFDDVSPSSLRGARFCFDRGREAALAALAEVKGAVGASLVA